MRTLAPVDFSVPPKVRMQKLAGELITLIWSACNEACNDDALDSDNAIQTLESAVQKRLLKEHPSLLVNVLATAAGKPVAGKRKHDHGDPPPMRAWRPTRPALAKAAAQMIHDEIGMEEAPVVKREGCELPFKLFSKLVAAKLALVPEGAAFSKTSIEFAVGEVVAAIFNEAEKLRLTQAVDAEGTDAPSAALLELHGCSDAAWAGTAARGTGLAMNEAGKKLMTSAARRVVDRLGEPEMQVRKFKA